MSDAVFPTLPGLRWDVSKTPEWSTKVQRAVSGLELRAAFFTYPIWHFKLDYELLRAGAEAELQTLMGFFNLRQGSFDSFLYLDPDDHNVSDGHFGTGNGTQTVFQLTRVLGGFVEPVKAPKGTPQIFKDGVLQASGYILSPAGQVTFSSPPAAGTVLSWTGEFYFRVRFAKDQAEFKQFMHQLWNLKQVELVSLK
ncbi:MAG: DUF2460 domain-containing protein [Pseudomonadota bacterium]